MNICHYFIIELQGVQCVRCVSLVTCGYVAPSISTAPRLVPYKFGGL